MSIQSAPEANRYREQYVIGQHRRGHACSFMVRVHEASKAVAGDARDVQISYSALTCQLLHNLFLSFRSLSRGAQGDHTANPLRCHGLCA